MAFFDSGNSTRMDSGGIRFDEATPTALTGTQKMPTITLDLQSKTDTELALDAKAVFESTDGVAKYAGAQATITLLGAAVTGFETSLGDQAMKEAASLAATQTKDTKRTTLEAALASVTGAFSTIVPPLTEADILAAHLSVRAAATPIGALPAVIDFLATMGDAPGENDLTWSRVKGARIYEVEYRVHVPGSPWVRLNTSPTKSKVTVPGLIGGTEYAFRVRAVGSSGPGPWSDESVKMAP